MTNQYIMGYKIHLNITHFTPNTVLFSSETDCITVSMVNNVLDYVLVLLHLRILCLNHIKSLKQFFP